MVNIKSKQEHGKNIQSWNHNLKYILAENKKSYYEAHDMSAFNYT